MLAPYPFNSFASLQQYFFTELDHGRTVIRVIALLTCFAGLIVIATTGCGEGNSSGRGPIPPSTTSVAITLVGSPQAVAAQVGTGAFQAQTSNPLILVLPSVTSKYAVAWRCFGIPLTTDFVLEATPQDSTQYTVGCPNGFSQTAPPTGLVAASGSVDASAILGVNFVSIYGNQGGFAVFGASGSFNMTVQPGANDVAVVATQAYDVLAVKILHSQIIPGPINGGNTITLGLGDLVTNQPLTVANIPAGFPTTPPVMVNFQSANGTAFQLANAATTEYPALPAAAVQNGDTYVFTVQTSDVTNQRSIGITQSITTGGRVTLALPQPWSSSGPAPAAFPTFTFDYSEFAGLPVVTEGASISTTVKDAGEFFTNSVRVSATGSYQNGANTVTIPDLTGIDGFQRNVPSGITASWTAFISAGTAPEAQFVPGLLANGSVLTVATSGAYTMP